MLQHKSMPPAVKPVRKPAATPLDSKAEDRESAAFLEDVAADVLARTIYGEARGEAPLGREAVAAVVINRVRIAEDKGGYWWGEDIVSVCQKPYQFSCWLPQDPNLYQISSVTARDPLFATCLRIARRAVLGLLHDPTLGATHYHASSIRPGWARDQKPVARIGRHVFYKLVN